MLYDLQKIYLLQYQLSYTALYVWTQLLNGTVKSVKHLYVLETGWYIYENEQLPLLWPGFKSWTCSHKWVESSRVWFLPRFRGFPMSSLLFIPPHKHPKFILIQSQCKCHARLSSGPPSHSFPLFFCFLFHFFLGLPSHCCPSGVQVNAVLITVSCSKFHFCY